jgi:type IV pilus assembly protein PilX
MNPYAPKSLTYNQRGMALVMALVFLVLLTLLGITAMSTSSLEEKMAGNAKDRGLAFQAAESALLHGEIWIANQVNLPIFDPSDITDGLHLPSTTATPVWTDAGGTNVWASTDFKAFSGLTKVASQPKVIIENLGLLRDPADGVGMDRSGSKTSRGATNAFRVTSRGVGGTPVASVMVQSVYVKRY